MIYDNRHRIFLQAIIQEGIILDQDALALCVKIFDTKINVLTIVTHINDKLAPLAMLMKAGLCEITGNKYWSIVGTTHEEAIIFPSKFTYSQKTFLQLIYFEIIGADDGCISSTDCLNLCNIIDTKFSMEEADEFLKYIISQKWLYKKHGYIYMGVRSIMELMPYFRTICQDQFHNCFLCREVIFSGIKCKNCKNIFHNYCVIRYLIYQNKTNCPQCKYRLENNSIPDEIIKFQSLNEASKYKNKNI